MRRFQHLDNLALLRTPKERVRDAILNLSSLLGACIVAWSIGSILVRLLASGGWFRALVVCLLAAVIIQWMRWSSWARRFRLVILLLLVSVGLGPFFIDAAPAP